MREHPERVEWVKQMILWDRYGYVPVDELSYDQVTFFVRRILSQRKEESKKSENMKLQQIIAGSM